MKRHKTIFFIQLIFFLCCSIAFGFRPSPPYPYKKVTNDDRYVFVMIPPQSNEDFEGYPVSGLYSNDGSKTPIWSVKWYTFSVDVASDGQHLIKKTSLATSTNLDAVAFFKNGEIINSYYISELVLLPRFMPHYSSYHFIWRVSDSFNEEKLLYSLVTYHGEFYLFDAATGEILSSLRLYLWIAALFIHMVLFGKWSGKRGFISIVLLISFIIFIAIKYIFLTGNLFGSLQLTVSLVFFGSIFFILRKTIFSNSEGKYSKLYKHVKNNGRKVILLFLSIVSVLHISMPLFVSANRIDRIKEAATISEPKHEKKISNRFDMEFVYIEPGTFMMGSPSDERGRDYYETQHQVTLTKGFYMQATEVTQKQWKKVTGFWGSRPYYFRKCGGDCPVEQVSWDDVKGFIHKLNKREGRRIYRLPTEAEWEYAARAGSTGAFANGDISDTGCGHDPSLDGIGWYCYNSNDTIHPVAQKQPNAWGLYDMHGNVWEVCQDWYDPEYPSGSYTDPIGPSFGYGPVVRGGSYNSESCICRSATRSLMPPKRRHNTGFRLVMNP